MSIGVNRRLLLHSSVLHFSVLHFSLFWRRSLTGVYQRQAVLHRFIHFLNSTWNNNLSSELTANNSSMSIGMIRCLLLHFSVLHSSVLHFSVLHFSVLHFSVLHFSVLHFSVLYPLKHRHRTTRLSIHYAFHNWSQLFCNF